MEDRTHELNDATLVAEAANVAKSAFLANMSHELRTPLHGILSFAKFGMEKLGQVDDARIMTYFSQINTSGERLKVLLNDLLDLSKLEAGKMEMHFDNIDMKEIIKGCVAEQEAVLKLNDLIVSYVFEISSPELYCDPVRIGQVVMNLLSNAIKHSPKGGENRISVTPDKLQIREEQTVEAVLTTISDQGRGVPKGEEEAVFNKFVQSSNDHFANAGTGLGLAICRELIEAHKGRIWCENRTAGGANFYFILPVSSLGD